MKKTNSINQNTYLLLIGMLCILYAACSDKKNDVKKDESQLLKEINETFTQYHNDIRTSGLTAEFTYLDSSTDFFWVPPGHTSALSIDSVITIINQNAKTNKKVDNKVAEMKVHLLSETIASYWAIINSEVTNTSDSISRFKLIETGTMIKKDNKWKFINGHTSLLNN